MLFTSNMTIERRKHTNDEQWLWRSGVDGYETLLHAPTEQDKATLINPIGRLGLVQYAME